MPVKEKGFTLIEALIAILIATLVILGITGLITNSITLTRKKILMECLISAANSAIEACRGGVNINSYQCGGPGGMLVRVSVDTDCSEITPPANFWEASCRRVTVTATYGSEHHKLTDLICKFGDENL